MKTPSFCFPVLLILGLQVGICDSTNAQRQSYNIQGTIYHASTEQPFNGVRVSLKKSPSNITIDTKYTDSLGYYFFSTQELPSFSIQAFATDYTTQVSEAFSPSPGKQYTVESMFLESKGQEIKLLVTHKVVTVKFFAETKLIENKMLPTKGAYELFYALNPDLREKDSISSNYVINNPQFPEMSQATISYFKEQYKIDKAKNKTTQSQLLDSIGKCNQLYTELNTLLLKNSNSADAGMSRKLIDAIYESLNHYKTKVKKTRNEKSLQIINLTSACSEIIQKSIRAHSIPTRDKEKLKNILEDLSLLLPSDAYGKFMASNSSRQGHGGIFIGAAHKDELDSQNSIFMDESGFIDMAETSLGGKSSLRQFAFVIWKMSASGVPITDGEEVTGRYLVYYYPPALKDDTLRYFKCDPPASFAQVSLPRARFGIMVKDSHTMKPVEISDPLIDTLAAFRTGSNLAIGGINYKRIIIQVKN